ncbi:hypothetical protein ELUMI_v1c05380 [Williamsoniiplasma luminosum]|uniref:Uncharacterized protein n=1 Tax=Williamsoniiplasma luminosum TaxID=214888 RepID=A0A2K8NTU3_9MOLU|nr:hypothetical protein [Williamsoniiplasma luminosum]ATZ17262.1 hypothetical protein ELUMI_v1c05380 [Williamsoniiplasma luminosum]
MNILLTNIGEQVVPLPENWISVDPTSLLPSGALLALSIISGILGLIIFLVFIRNTSCFVTLKKSNQSESGDWKMIVEPLLVLIAFIGVSVGTAIGAYKLWEEINYITQDTRKLYSPRH